MGRLSLVGVASVQVGDHHDSLGYGRYRTKKGGKRQRKGGIGMEGVCMWGGGWSDERCKVK